jgi:hypothetical protein
MRSNWTAIGSPRRARRRATRRAGARAPSGHAAAAPPIEAIVEGRQPRALTVRRLLQGIPCAWADQRKVFGFAG